MLGKEREKYKIISLDIDEEANALVKDNVYTLFPKNEDSFLLEPNFNLSDAGKLLKGSIFEIMSETEPPEYEINSGQMFRYKNVQDKQRYFKLNEDVKSCLTFLSFKNFETRRKS